MKIDIATKRVFKTIAQWAIFWIIYACIDLLIVDRFFGTAITTALLEQPNYFYGIVGIAFTFYTSKFEALFWHQSGAKYPPYNPHALFMYIRIAFLIPIYFQTSLLAVLCYVAAFPCLHDGFYYWQRNKLDSTVYPKKFLDQSTTSTAFWTKYFPPIVRIPLAIVGVVCLILIQIFNVNIF